MTELIQVCVNNGVGVCSFLALLYFANKFLSSMNDTLSTISETLALIQVNLSNLTNRVEEIENKLKKEG